MRDRHTCVWKPQQQSPSFKFKRRKRVRRGYKMGGFKSPTSLLPAILNPIKWSETRLLSHHLLVPSPNKREMFIKLMGQCACKAPKESLWKKREKSRIRTSSRREAVGKGWIGGRIGGVRTRKKGTKSWELEGARRNVSCVERQREEDKP